MGRVPIRFKAFAMPSGRSAAAWGWKVIVPVSEGAYHASDLRTSVRDTMGLSTGPLRESPTETDLDEARFPGGGTVIGLTDGRKAIFLVHLVIMHIIVIIQ